MGHRSLFRPSHNGHFGGWHNRSILRLSLRVVTSCDPFSLSSLAGCQFNNELWTTEKSTFYNNWISLLFSLILLPEIRLIGQFIEFWRVWKCSGITQHWTRKLPFIVTTRETRSISENLSPLTSSITRVKLDLLPFLLISFFYFKIIYFCLNFII